MNDSYKDIIDLIDTEPLWWDENAVPRYKPYHPRMGAIYGNQSCLLLIACQSCGQQFKVGMKYHAYQNGSDLKTRIKKGTIHYGDPPNVDCCPAGGTMNSDPIRVLQFWEFDLRNSSDWQRLPEFEIEINE